MLCLLFGFLLYSDVCLSAEPVTGAVVIAPSQSVSTAEVDVTWQATGNPGFVKIDGKGGHASCVLKGQTADCDCPMASFDTGIDMRNKHMREKYLDVAKYPAAHLHVASVKDGAFEGTLQVKADTKPVKGSFVLASDGTLTAEFHVSIEDYPSIGVPSYLGVTVAKDVVVKVSGKAK